MSGFLSINNIAFVIFGYPMSYVELVGTILYLWSVWLISRRQILTWPVGIVSVILYMLLFYQIRLYSDFLEQIYYLGASVYGWIVWNKSVDDGQIKMLFMGTGDLCFYGSRLHWSFPSWWAFSWQESICCCQEYSPKQPPIHFWMLSLQ